LKEAGIFYGSSSGKTEAVALRICEKLEMAKADVRDISESSPTDLLQYRLLILGVPTWGIGELQEDWQDFLPVLENLELSGRKAALFGLGDQESYPDTFADALGKVYDSLCLTGCEIVGRWPVTGYMFSHSAAIRDGMFAGLVLDEENQGELTERRLDEWLGKIIPKD
jgi:flavodoxin I